MDFSAITCDFAALSAFKDFTITQLASEEKVRFKIESDTLGTILDNTYYYGFDGKVHLDLTGVFLLYANFGLPRSTSQPQSGLITDQIFSFQVYRETTSSWVVKSPRADFFEHSAVEQLNKNLAVVMSDVDYLRIPADYIFTLPLPNHQTSSNSLYFVPEFVSKGESRICDHIRIFYDDNDNRRINMFYSDDNLRPAPGMPFFIRVKWYHTDDEGDTDGGPWYYRTPVYEVVNGDFEQYLFRNKYGAFDNIPMDGTFKFIPEYDIQTVRFDGSTERISADRSRLYSQSSGALSPKTAKALSELLLSDDIYHYDKDSSSWKKIIIESPTVEITEAGTDRAVSFRWRYADDN